MNEKTKQELKELGLSELEIISKEGIEAIFRAIEIIITNSENKIDDIVLSALPFVKSKLIELVEKISN